MPKLWFLAFFVCSNRRWARLDWEAICQSRAVRCLVLRGFSSEALAGLLARINELDGLVWLRLYNSSFATPDEFTGQFVHRLLDASCCPKLSNLRVLFSLNTEYIKTVKELKRTRPSLCIDVDSEESDYEDNDTSDGDEFTTADSEDNYVEHSAY
ncbi:hypothetical protein FRC12_018552 [Ceratobasidium sp. 428]|nr:hypothetical protein FRC12_018552 [Ceratobasidium sp. 428]